MDFMEVLKSAIRLFVRIANINCRVGGYDITLASVIIFVGLVMITVRFLRGLAD